MTFSHFQLDAEILRGVEDAGYETPTPIQEKAIPQALAGRDILGTAQTGTGKTAAFVLPILQALKKERCDVPRCLVLTPTRELAQQIHDHVEMLGKHCSLRSLAVYGGTSIGKQIEALKRGVDILVACPGRLLDLVNRRKLTLKKISIFVLDEADRMFDMGFFPDVNRILMKLPEDRQTLFFSATFAPAVERLAKKILRDPERIAAGEIRPVHTVSHALYPVQKFAKARLVLAILEQMDTRGVLIFTRTRSGARSLFQQVNRAGYTATSLHSDRTQKQREQALRGFREGRYRVMIATDIAARGLDIEDISHVINFDMPSDSDSYIHRIGRTGRAERSGDAISLVTMEDLPLIHELERVLGEKIERKMLDEFDYSDPLSSEGPGSLASDVRVLMEGNASSRPVPSKRKFGRRRRRI